MNEILIVAYGITNNTFINSNTIVTLLNTISYVKTVSLCFHSTRRSVHNC